MAAASPLPAPEARPHSREKGSSKLAGTSRESPQCNRLVTGVRQSHILFVIVRRTVIGFGMALAFISYLDRACISQAAPMIARDLHFNTIQMGYIFSAFGLTYAAMEIPSGWLIDRFGPRLVLTRVVLCWSFFTAATGLAWNLWSMLTARLLFGAGEAGCFPGLAKTFSNWLPPDARARRRLESCQRAMGRSRGSPAGGCALCSAGLARDLRAVRCDRRDLGGLLLRLVL